MKKITLNVENKEVLNLVESLQYEVESRKEIVSFMVDKGLAGTENFMLYQQEYRELFVQLGGAKDALEQEIKAALPGKQVLSWNLEFAKHELTVTVAD